MSRDQIQSLARQSREQRMEWWAENFWLAPSGVNAPFSALATAPTLSSALEMGGMDSQYDLTLRLTDKLTAIVGQTIKRGRDGLLYRIKEIKLHPHAGEQVWQVVAA